MVYSTISIKKFQISLSCMGSPCVFGCQPSANGPICTCPNGYRTVGQGHCLSTVNPTNGVFPNGNGYQTFGPGQQTLYHSGDLSVPPSKDKYLSTEGCFSCKVKEKIFFFLLILALTFFFLYL